MACKGRRAGFTLIELLLVLGVIAILLAMVLPAVQRIRAAAARIQCQNNLRQIGLALHQFHDLQRGFPPGMTYKDAQDRRDLLSWRVRILPLLEQGAVWQQAEKDYAQGLDPRFHAGATQIVLVFGCPLDGRVESVQTYNARQISVSSYVGVSGTNWSTRDGVFFKNSRVRIGDIIDGSSSTLLVGERPPSNNLRYGWFYYGVGQGLTGSLDHHVGVRELARLRVGCPPGPYEFKPRVLGEPCAFMQFWSLHEGGANFIMADGSVHFLTYSVNSILPALATRGGGEPASLP